MYTNGRKTVVNGIESHRNYPHLASHSVAYSLPKSFKNRHGANRTPTPTPKLQRKPSKPKPPLAHNLVYTVQPLHMRDTALAASIMSEEVQLSFGGRGHGFDAKHLAALVGEPVHAFERQAGEGVLPFGIVGVDAPVVGHVQENGVALSDFLAGGFEGGWGGCVSTRSFG